MAVAVLQKETQRGLVGNADVGALEGARSGGHVHIGIVRLDDPRHVFALDSDRVIFRLCELRLESLAMGGELVDRGRDTVDLRSDAGKDAVQRAVFRHDQGVHRRLVFVFCPA